MTIGSLAPAPAERKARKGKQAAEECAPLLPSRREDAGESSGASSFAGAVSNLSTTIVGAGIMALPDTMRVLGLVPGVAMVVFVAFLAEASIEMLLRFNRAGKKTSFGGVVGDAFGEAGRVLLQACIVVNNVGILIVNMIIIDSLRYTSALSVGLAVVFIIITAGVAIVKLLGGSTPMPRLVPSVTDLTAFWKLFTVVPVIVTSYICHYNVHTIDNELEDSTQIQPVVQASLASCSTVYITTSFFGFLLFGDGTIDDVLANFDSYLGIPYSSFLNDTVRVSYAVHLMLVFPIVFFALRLNVDGLHFPSARPSCYDNRRFILITVLLIARVLCCKFHT